MGRRQELSTIVPSESSDSVTEPERRRAALARNRGPRWDRTHRQLIDTAAQAFYQYGIRAVGVELLAELAGVTKATLYSHFASKDEMIASCLDTLDLRYFEWFVAQVVMRETDPLGRIHACFTVLDKWFHQESFRGCAFINAAVELASGDHPARGVVLAHKARTVAYLRELADSAEFEDPDELAAQLMLLMEGAIITALVQSDLDAARRAGTIARALIESWPAAQARDSAQ